ncbi:type II secretion system F family protein [Mycobacterium sp. NPDC048908]|uniref:type II secretion system F family protein n=1 Tax=Mycobacterium sp. NPDC048908 TaxID=3364292 RepID=UPI0037105669
MTWAALLLAAALVVGGDSRPRLRARVGTVGPGRPAAAPPADDPLATASSLDVFAACLRSGMAVSTAASATAASASAPLARLLNRAADLLALGADPSVAWTGADGPGSDGVEALMRLARRSASSGTALAQAVAELADQSRHQAAAAAKSAAERASVLIAGPLGLCYLPAFVCLGIVPVVAGLAGDVLRSGIL